MTRASVGWIASAAFNKPADERIQPVPTSEVRFKCTLGKLLGKDSDGRATKRLMRPSGDLCDDDDDDHCVVFRVSRVVRICVTKVGVVVVEC